MPKGQAPYVSVNRKLKSIAREAVSRGLMDEVYVSKLPERHPVTQQFKSRFYSEPGFKDNRKNK